MIDIVSETVRQPWNEIYNMNIYEFFNLCSYAKEKSNRRAKQIEEMKKRH